MTPCSRPSASGATGWIAGLANALPRESVDLFNYGVNGETKRHSSCTAGFLPLLRMDTVPNFVQLIKLVQAEVGDREFAGAPATPRVGWRRTGAERRKLLVTHCSPGRSRRRASRYRMENEMQYIIRMTKLSGRSLIGFREGTGAGEAVVRHQSHDRTNVCNRASSRQQRRKLNSRSAWRRKRSTVYQHVSGTGSRRILAHDCGEDRIDCGGDRRACRAGNGFAAGALARRDRAHLRPASAVRAGGGRGIVGAGAHRPRRSRSQARSEARHSLDAAAAWARGGIRRQQFSAGIFRRRRRHSFGARGGNTVIVKAHAAHPGTSELVGHAIQESVRECGLPEGVFSLLFGSGPQIGTALMKHPLVRAGGFTGSRTAGRILMDVAASRPEPIPFYAEMSSTNPVFILPGALRERGDNIAAGLHAFVHLGRGSVLHEAGNGFSAAGMRTPTPFTEKLQQLVDGIDPVSLADQGDSLFVRLGNCRSQGGSFRQTGGRGPGARGRPEFRSDFRAF